MPGSNKKCLLFFGAPGSGKGTQSEILVKNSGFYHISTGDLFRENLKKETELGLKAKSFIDAGNLVPDSITVDMLKDSILKLKQANFILDGFPRNLIQAEQLEVLSEELNFDIKKVIFLEVPDKVLFDRLTGRRVCKNCGAVYHMQYKPTKIDSVCDLCEGVVYQRKDDSSEVISHRLKTYEKATFPVKKFYEEKGILEIVDGQGLQTDIEKRIKSIVKNF
jgi:adenylate kinase